MYNIVHLMKTYNALSKSDMKSPNIRQWFGNPFKINTMRL